MSEAEDDDDGVFDEVEEEDEDVGKKRKAKGSKKKSKKLKSFLDDAAEESGEENNDDDDDDEDEDDEGENDYIRDDFLVDEDDEEEEEENVRKRRKKKKKSDLEDSDDDDDDDVFKKKKASRFTRFREKDRLTEDDLMLIQESKGTVTARNEAELSRGLFYDPEGEEEEAAAAAAAMRAKKRKHVVDAFDEDGMDDFIDDDIGDQDDIMAGDRYEDGRGDVVNEAALHEAEAIFGRDYLDFMQQSKREDEDEEDEEDGRNRFKERGVGVLDVDSEEGDDEDEDEDDEDLFGEDDEDKAEALKMKRDKRRKKKEDRRKQAISKKHERRKAQLRRAFEPVQLVENFCTERDDEIRRADAPERYFDWHVPFHGGSGVSSTDAMTEEEEEEAIWIMQRIPNVCSEFHTSMHPQETGEEQEARQQGILKSIVHALRFMHLEKMEAAFISRYRRDIVTSPAVRDALYDIMDQDAEWDRLLNARNKVETILQTIASEAQEQGNSSSSQQQDPVRKLRQEWNSAKERLDESAKQENSIKDQLSKLENKPDNAGDDDDELFDDDEDEEAKAKQKSDLESHLTTIQSLLQERAERVEQLETQLRLAEANAESTTQDDDDDQLQMVAKKICRESLWNLQDYFTYLSVLVEERQILDVHGYFQLLKEGNDAVQSKSKTKKRSRRFDRDYYRTCVAQGLRSIAYKYLLAPNRVGIRLQDGGEFEFAKTLPGEEEEEGGDPLKWVAPVIFGMSPQEFAGALVSSGELALLTASGEALPTHLAMSDPLRGCRYVAAMELAYEPRIRKWMRETYRKKAFLSTQPTKKGLDSIDAFSEYYGLHLIREKPISDHFPKSPQEKNAELSKLHGLDERKELDAEWKRRERIFALQYLNILKAEKTGDILVYIHLPFLDHGNLSSSSPDWYKRKKEDIANRENQDISCLFDELEKLYLPMDGDTDEWNEERRKVLRIMLFSFVLPQLEHEVRKDLKEVATKAGIKAATEELSNMAMQGPYRPASLAHTENRFLVPTGDLPMVGVCCSSDAQDATYMSATNKHGEFAASLAIPGGTRIEQLRDKVISFLLTNRPAAVLVGTSGGFTSRLMNRKLVDLVNEAVHRWNGRDIQGHDEDDEEFELRRQQFRKLHNVSHHDDDSADEEFEWKCNVDLMDDSVAQLFGRSVRGTKEFPSATTNQKIALAIARYAKDPLAELVYAWSVASDAGVFGTEMLFLNIFRLQQLLPKTLLLRHYQRCLCEAVASVGTDINMACNYKHLHGLLAFVPGLGPRKAANIKQSIAQFGGVIPSRRALLEKRHMGPVVYNNAVAFIRIRELEEHQFVDGQQYSHPLDDTRLHPDVYHRNNWAAKIAVDALELSDEDAQRNNATRALRNVMENSSKEVERLFQATKAEWEKHYGQTFNIAGWNPRVDVPPDQWRDKVEELDLDTFAQMIEQGGHGLWHSHLQMIKWEFRLPFVDVRKPMEPLTGDKLFKLITGESEFTLRPGKEITGRVIRNGEYGSRVKCEGDIPGFIHLRNLADEHVEAAEDVVSLGTVVTAIVTNIKPEHMSLDLSLKMEDFRKSPSLWERPASLPPLDERYFDRPAAMRVEEEKRKERERHLEALQLKTNNQNNQNNKGIAEGNKIRGRVTRRACAHPSFRNAKQDQVDKELRALGEDGVGECRLRPSSKNSDSLAVHWVVRVGSIKVIEVLEEDKDTDTSIGNVLKIKNETYGSIDELIGRYIEPMNDHVETLINHRKFLQNMSEDQVDERLKQEKQANPKGMFYNLCWMEMYPGYASLRYILSSTPRNHPVGISPNGFIWLSKVYVNLDLLLNDFKKNPRGKSATTNSQQQRPPPRDVSSQWGQQQQTMLPPAWQSQPQWNAPNLPPPPRGYQPPPPGPPPPPQVYAPPYPPPPPGPPPNYNHRPR